MKLVIGLGNPGRKYQGTRHNVGFAVLDELARLHATSFPKANFQGEVVEANLGGHRGLLLWPHTYMNLSGTSVLAARDFYKVNQEELLVVCDDFHLPLARLRLRPQGSAGGQKGLADIIRRLGSEQFPRLRIGVGELPAGWDAADFVLSKFKKEESSEIAVAIGRAADAITLWAREGLQPAMNQFNA